MEAPDLVYARSMEYDLNCNWKVFCDNYLVRAHSRPCTHCWRFWACDEITESPCSGGHDNFATGKHTICP